jgi:CRISPR-associated endonuclease/helicase Cas3
MKRPDPLAHVAQDAAGGWREHALDAHLEAVSRLAAATAAPFGAADWAGLAGLWHDLGKYRPAFQARIRRVSGYDPDAHIEGAENRPDHSTAGALHALAAIGPLHGTLLAYLIAGHHAGLPDWDGSAGSLAQRLEGGRQAGWLAEVLSQTPPEAVLAGQPPLCRPRGRAADLHLWIRMLFSCLVDADFLDTEGFMAPEQAAARGSFSSVGDMAERLTAHLERLSAEAPATPVNRVRATVLRRCIAAANEPPGLFSLTVPTGGGKTLSSLAFALHHAARHGKRRVVYAIPYLSIIEQTADVVRGIFGDDVVEHHSNLDPDRESLKSRLAAENWDAPLIVTTNVQLFESLYAVRTSRCRKLHNLVDAVVILDEAQLLPPEHLDPCLAAVRTLTECYGVTFVLCTATQPAFAPRDLGGRRFAGLAGVREIVADPAGLFRDLERVQVRWPADLRERSAWEEVADRMARYPQALAVVNRKTDARALARLVPESLYLSTDLCGEHRARRIDEIRDRLARGALVRVVSTQLIEAGVDVDFPVVFRALAGIDSIAQAAGRCNREGRLSSQGEVHVFVPPAEAPPGLLLKGEQATRELLTLDPSPALTPPLFDRYFRLWYAQVNSFDKSEVLPLLQPDDRLRIQFREAAARFRLIPDEGAPVVVPWGEGAKWLAMLKAEGPERWLLRKLQRYCVTVRPRCLEALLARGDVAPVLPGLYAQVSDLLYDEALGFIGCAEDASPPAGTLVV